MKITVDRILFAGLLVWATVVGGSKPPSTNTILRLSTPVETPDGVHFTWTGGATNTNYSLWRRLNSDGTWEKIKVGLQGTSGATDLDGFTLDNTWEYKIQAD
jgi:hypothetical protein